MIMPCWQGEFALDFPDELREVVSPSGRVFKVVQHGDVCHVSPPPRRCLRVDLEYLEHKFTLNPYKKTAAEFHEKYL